MKAKKSGAHKSSKYTARAASAPKSPTPHSAAITLVDQETRQQVILREPHVIVPVRQLRPGQAIAQAWHASHYPGCWEDHGGCAKVRLTELFSAGTTFINLFQSIPPPMSKLQPMTRHLYAKYLGELMSALAKCAFPEMKGMKIPDAEDDLKAMVNAAASDEKE